MEACGAASSEQENVMSIYMHDVDDMDCWHWGGWQSDSQKSRFRRGGLGGSAASYGDLAVVPSVHKEAPGT